MPKFAEVIFETGSKSVVSYDSEDQLKQSLAEHNRRAVTGSRGGPAGHAAERIKKVLLYNDHPGDFNESGLVDASPLKTDLAAFIDSKSMGGQVSAWEVISYLRNLLGPLKAIDEVGAHDSMHKATEVRELDLEGVV